MYLYKETGILPRKPHVTVDSGWARTNSRTLRGAKLLASKRQVIKGTNLLIGIMAPDGETCHIVAENKGGEGWVDPVI